MDFEIVLRFDDLLFEGRYEEAADCLDEDVLFSSPKFTYKSKSEWLNKFPIFHKKNSSGKKPDFEPLERVSDNVYIRRGKAVVMGFKISVRETIEFNEEGKIVSSKLQMG